MGHSKNDQTSLVGTDSLSARRLRALLEGMLDPVISIDDHGKILEASRSVERVFGYRPEELLGENIKILTPEPYRSEHDRYLERYRQTGKTFILGNTRQFEVVHKDGGLVPCELSVSRVDVPEDDRPMFIGSFRDITDRKRAESALMASERSVRAIFDQVIQFVGLLDLEGRILEVNHAALESAGATRKEVLGIHFWEAPWILDTKDSRRKMRLAVERAARGKFVRREAEYQDKDGKCFPVDFSLKPIRDEAGRVVLLLPEGRDISFIKEAQRRETTMLRALAAIGESASILAHEIKNPITAIHLALRAVAGKLGEDHRVVLEDMATRMERLESTMRRTLSFTAPLKMRWEVLDPAAMLERIAAEAQPQIDQNGVSCEIEIDPNLPYLRGDRALLEEVLTNLVVNAIESLEEGGRMVLRAARDGAGHVRLEVEDDGAGIPPRIRSDLFKPFVSTKANGTGLGLALSKKIVEEHGGTIEVECGSLGGARFRIRLNARE